MAQVRHDEPGLKPSFFSPNAALKGRSSTNSHEPMAKSQRL